MFGDRREKYRKIRGKILSKFENLALNKTSAVIILNSLRKEISNFDVSGTALEEVNNLYRFYHYDKIFENNEDEIITQLLNLKKRIENEEILEKQNYS